MLKNLPELKQGSLLFFNYRYTVISFLIAPFIRGEHAHIAVYMGDGVVLESSWFRQYVKQTTIQKFLDNNCIDGEVVTIFNDPLDIKLFMRRIKDLQRNKELPFPEVIQHALFGLEIEIKPKNKKVSICDIYKKIKKLLK